MTEIRHTGGEEDVTIAPRAEGETVEVRHGMFGAHGTGDTSGYGGLVRPVQLPGSTPRRFYGVGVARSISRSTVRSISRSFIRIGPVPQAASSPPIA